MTQTIKEAEQLGRELAREDIIRSDAQGIIGASFGMFSDLGEVALRAYDNERRAQAAEITAKTLKCAQCGGPVQAFGPYGHREYSCDKCGRINGPLK